MKNFRKKKYFLYVAGQKIFEPLLPRSKTQVNLIHCARSLCARFFFVRFSFIYSTYIYVQKTVSLCTYTYNIYTLCGKSVCECVLTCWFWWLVCLSIDNALFCARTYSNVGSYVFVCV